jgi:hypothetical protein
MTLSSPAVGTNLKLIVTEHVRSLNFRNPKLCLSEGMSTLAARKQ